MVCIFSLEYPFRTHKQQRRGSIERYLSNLNFSDVNGTNLVLAFASDVICLIKCTNKILYLQTKAVSIHNQDLESNKRSTDLFILFTKSTGVVGNVARHVLDN